MANNGFKVLDSDMHILEPADLWQRYIDKKFKHRAPIGTTDHVRDLRLVGPDGAPGAARPIRHLEHFPRRVTFFTRIRNSLKLTTSVAGRHKFSSTPWKKKE
jgi:hypothetical protein